MPEPALETSQLLASLSQAVVVRRERQVPLPPSIANLTRLRMQPKEGVYVLLSAMRSTHDTMLSSFALMSAMHHRNACYSNQIFATLVTLIEPRDGPQDRPASRLFTVLEPQEE